MVSPCRRQGACQEGRRQPDGILARGPERQADDVCDSEGEGFDRLPPELLVLTPGMHRYQGNEREPYFPRPVILDIDMTIPLLNLDISQGQLEEKSVYYDVGLVRDQG